MGNPIKDPCPRRTIPSGAVPADPEAAAKRRIEITIDGRSLSVPEGTTLLEAARGIGIEWAGLPFEERSSGSQTVALYSVALLMVSLCLSALYESLSIPFSVLMYMPLGAPVVLPATSLRGPPYDAPFHLLLFTYILPSS